MPSAMYDIVKIEPDKVFIIDLDLPGFRSVTNSAECVWVELQKMFPGRRVIYRDTMGRWDEIVICGSKDFVKTLGHQAVKFFNTEFRPYKDEIPTF